jgi:hypothetical protein
MQIVYQAANLADAHLLRQLLEDAGIPVHLNGEYLQGALGEVPANTPILLMVPDEHVQTARVMVLDWERATPQYDEAPEDDAAAPTPAFAPVHRGGSVFTAIGSLLFGAVCGGAVVWTVYNRPGTPGEIDYDGDGRIDERVFFAGERVDRVEIDRNRDGRVDQIVRYRPKGDPKEVGSDDDFDGRFERTDTYHDGQPETWTIDHDGDGGTDFRGSYENGVYVLDEWLDRSGRVVKTVRYRNGWPVSSEIDSDGDGKLDTARTYDARGEISNSRSLP